MSGSDQHEREIANAVFVKLQKAEWEGRSMSRRIGDFGNSPPFHPVCTATIPNPSKRDAVVREHERLALITRTDTHHVLLPEKHYMAALVDMPPEEFKAHQHSLTGPRGAPYRWRGDRLAWVHTEYGWDAWWARHARLALARVVAVTLTWPLDTAPPDLVMTLAAQCEGLT